MTFLAIILTIFCFATVPLMVKILWNVGVVSLLNYFGITVAPITYGIAILIWILLVAFFGRSSTDKSINTEEFCIKLFTKFISMWLLILIVYVVVAIIF